eukprot:TRINITY_DN659_c0_g1_i2.p1 TRINITY_DN659_c0_g1~~TRINITY_DN659_c0_g1_i2.p1  ORF type:complete len:295 (+),score=56.92 TRINITY_DN659_c0_g1_i2:166-1050(+)
MIKCNFSASSHLPLTSPLPASTTPEVTNLDHIDGARINIDKHANAQAWSSQTFGMTRPTRMNPNAGSYNITWNYAPDNASIYRASYDPTQGGITAMAVRNILTPNTQIKASGLVGSDCATERTFSIDLNHKGDDYTAGVKFVTNGQVGVQYMQQLTSRFAAGGEGLHILDQLSFLNVGGRYIGDGWIGTGSYMATTTGVSRWNFGYLHRFMGRIELGAELDYDSVSGESGVKLGYQFALMNGVARGLVDVHSGKVTGQVEHRIPAMSRCSLILSGSIDHYQSDYSFGVGLNIAS